MRSTRLLIPCLVLLAAPARGQDPITGSWKAEVTPADGNTRKVTFELKYDGKSVVTGNIIGLPSPGDVKSGSYDTTTKALKLSVGPTDGPVMASLAGTVVNGTVTGTGLGTDGSNVTFIMTKNVSDSGPAGGDAATAAKAGFAEVSAWVTKAAELVPANKYSYRPAPTVRTYGQIIGHIADAYGYYCGRATNPQTQWSDAIAKGPTDKATLGPKLKQALDACNAAYSANGDIGQLMANVAHTSLHYGNLVTYIRMLGMVPPSS
jgi:hypothetical protein